MLNEELKHNLKKTVQENVHKAEKQTSTEEVDDLLEKLSPEQLEELKRNCMLQKVMVRKTTVMTEQNEVVDEQRRIQRI